MAKYRKKWVRVVYAIITLIILAGMVSFSFLTRF